MPHLLTGDYLFQNPTNTPNSFFVLLPIFFGFLLVASILTYWRRAALAPENPVLRRFVRRAAKAGMWFGGLGLALAVLRYVQFDYLDLPIWMLLLILSLIGAIGYFVYDWSERYPVAVWKLQEAQIERRYHPTTERRVKPQPVRPNPKLRGKRRR
jgi:hypothetical protein